MKNRIAILLQIVAMSALFDLLILPAILPSVEMQSCPDVHPLSPQHPSWYCWPSNTQARYFFTNSSGVRSFTETEKTLYRESFAVWNARRFPGNNCSGVFFSESSGTSTFEIRKMSDSSPWTPNFIRSAGGYWLLFKRCCAKCRRDFALPGK